MKIQKTPIKWERFRNIMPKYQTRIEKLLAELCPEGVEFKELIEICQINRGRVMSKDYLRDHAGSYPVYSSQTANEGVFGYIDSFDYDFESVTWTTDGANAGSVFYHCDNKFSITNVCGLLRVLDNSEVNTKFLYYMLGQLTKHHVSDGMGNPKLMSNVMSKIKIPIPPLAIQQEIVKILDTFTTLEAELEAELEARKKQYEYYRDELLTFGDDVEWKTLGEVGKLIRGNGLQKKDFVKDGVGCIHYGQIYTYYGTFADKTKTFVSPIFAKKLKKAQKGDVLISGVSENIEDVCKPLGWLGDEICISGDMFAFRHNQNTKFITYLLQTTNFKRYKERFAHGAKVIRVKQEKILNFKIPIPPLAEQERIVAILDKFDALVNDISVGLPAEIAARKKQYEYYRNKLLTFQEKS